MIFSKKFVRPSVEVDWYEPSADFLAYVKEKWIVDEKIGDIVPLMSTKELNWKKKNNS